MNQPQLKIYPCAICGSASPEKIYTIKGFDIVRCTHCSFVFVNPRIPNEDLYKMYAQDYFSNANEKYGYKDYELTAHLRIKTFQKWIDTFRPFIAKEKGNVLDIGCASGYFLLEMKKLGWETEGIELDHAMIARLREAGLKIYDKPFETFSSDRKYSLITLFDVIEHIPDLKTAFQKLHDLLADDGIIVLITPDFSSRQRKIFGKKWFQFKPYEHIQYFTPQTLEKAITPFNLQLVHHEAPGQYADAGFLLNRLDRYNFPLFKKIASFFISLFGLKNKYWYLDTGSVFAVIKKK